MDVQKSIASNLQEFNSTKFRFPNGLEIDDLSFLINDRVAVIQTKVVVCEVRRTARLIIRNAIPNHRTTNNQPTRTKPTLSIQVHRSTE